MEEGGDWDRRNRLKVYRAVLHLSSREFSKAAELLLVSACALLGGAIIVRTAMARVAAALRLLPVPACWYLRAVFTTSGKCVARFPCWPCWQLPLSSMLALPASAQESVATFSSSELFSFHSLVFYTVLMSVHSLGRAPLKKRVIDSPDVQSAIRESAALTAFLHTIHECQYKQFFEALGKSVIRLMKLFGW